MTADEIQEFLKQEFPQIADDIQIDSLGDMCGRIRLRINDRNLRPGGTISGPTMFMLADVSTYILILAALGPKKLAVTTNCSIDFMRKPPFSDMFSDSRLLKLGRRLAVADILLYSDGIDKPVARAGITYSIPS